MTNRNIPCFSFFFAVFPTNTFCKLHYQALVTVPFEILNLKIILVKFKNEKKR